MCLIALSLGASERFPFVVSANRDEFLARPTQALAHWQTPAGTAVLSGRDLQGGGTWMGFSPNGRFAMLTNVRQPSAAPPAQPISRGTLALAWLDSSDDAKNFAASLDGRRYQGFNLIVGDRHQRRCFYLSNEAILKPFEPPALLKFAPNVMNLTVKEMPWNAVYGLSNAALDTAWPKTQRLKQSLESSLHEADALALVAQQLAALGDSQAAPDDALPSTGVSLDLERALSSIWVSHATDALQHETHYGTRSSLVALQTACGQLHVTELTYTHQAAAPPQRHQATLEGP
jgi:uncharacterized protein with NRDE domain